MQFENLTENDVVINTYNYQKTAYGYVSGRKTGEFQLSLAHKSELAEVFNQEFPRQSRPDRLYHILYKQNGRLNNIMINPENYAEKMSDLILNFGLENKYQHTLGIIEQAAKKQIEQYKNLRDRPAVNREWRQKYRQMLNIEKSLLQYKDYLPLSARRNLERQLTASGIKPQPTQTRYGRAYDRTLDI